MIICEPIFKLLKKDAATRWTEECHKASEKIKEYLSNPSVLVPPKTWISLLLYLSVIGIMHLDAYLGSMVRQ